MTATASGRCQAPATTTSKAYFDPSNMTLYGVVTFPYDCAHKDPPHVSPTDFRYAYVANAAAEALVNWATNGRKPPHAAYIKQTDLSNPSKATILRDRFGNALGGVRTPQLTVPRSTFNVIDDGPDSLLQYRLEHTAEQLRADLALQEPC